ncbi:MAG: TonB-dependent receptor plug domain-containing protein [Ignavibacteriae bacterium]|nr:TonB-dependent receptor plug domain-containing protein [Ignavibacteriota bacterium]
MVRHILASSRIAIALTMFSFLNQVYAQVVQDDTALTEKIDSLRTPITPIPLVGSIERPLGSEYIIPDSTINFMDYRYLGDLLSMTPGMFIRDLGSPGQFHGLTIQGLDARSIAFMSDGVLLNEPLTGLFDPNLYPTENIERIEVITGPRAFLYGLNGTGATINMVTKSKKAIRPYSRIRYSESIYGFGVVDGLISQDIIRGLNVTLGALHNTFDGRFPNSDYDAWNVRGKIRYNISNRVNVVASGMYNQTFLGLNGGVHDTTSPEFRFDRLRATMRNTDSYEKITRHDAQLGIAAKFFPDTNAISTVTLYFSDNLREYRDEENRPNSNGIFVKEDHLTQWYGVKLTQHTMIQNHQLDVGAEFQSRGVIASDVTGQRIRTLWSTYSRLGFQPFHTVIFSPYARFDSYLGHKDLSYGVDSRAKLLDWLEASAGYSNSYRFTTFQETYWDIDPTKCQIAGEYRENHHLAEVGLTLSNQPVGWMTIKYFYRMIEDPLELTYDELNDPSCEYVIDLDRKRIHEGLTATEAFRLGSFSVEGNAQYITITNGFKEFRFLPRWSGTGGIYFWDKLFNNHLDLKTGFRGRAFSSYRAVEYNQQAQVFLPSTLDDIPASAAIDFILIAHLGDAYFHLIWENLLDRQYITTTFYPMPDRAIRFSISWEFLD